MRPHNKKSCIEGTKVATSRTKIFGKVGDVFILDNVCFEITNVTKKTLLEVALSFFLEEGFNTPCEFAEEWVSIHPSGFNKDKIIYFHEFRRI